MQQHGSKYFARRPPSPPDHRGQKVKIQLFQKNMVMLHIKLNAITKCSNMVVNILPATPPPPTHPPPPPPPPPPTLGGNRSKFNFSEQFHVAFQIKGNHECSNMVANILPADRPTPALTLGLGSNGQKT